MKWRVPGQEVDQRNLGERLWKDCKTRGLNREDAMCCVLWFLSALYVVYLFYVFSLSTSLSVYLCYLIGKIKISKIVKNLKSNKKSDGAT